MAQLFSPELSRNARWIVTGVDVQAFAIGKCPSRVQYGQYGPLVKAEAPTKARPVSKDWRPISIVLREDISHLTQRDQHDQNAGLAHGL